MIICIVKKWIRYGQGKFLDAKKTTPSTLLEKNMNLLITRIPFIILSF